MTKYQLLFIIENGIDDEAKEAVVTKFTDLIASLGGTVTTVDKWGTRKYAYPINYKTEGYYVRMLFEAEPTVPQEVDRQMRINENIVRQLITKQA
ncbi:MAG: 30S ribosomal protein S6 [Firmicutes bacterium]|uniref:Small ribosomal subunit protein bS6 n=1 Tax=Candidatus Stercoripulliclostridium pullicola TaxID=2840953 RepID=A0A940DGQ2_9FIRM|nr:30S ribosomal protein S6 [Candidatus Stercoripulliclostridium pullicola]